jgi:hypothetical protein
LLDADPTYDQIRVLALGVSIVVGLLAGIGPAW